MKHILILLFLVSCSSYRPDKPTVAYTDDVPSTEVEGLIESIQTELKHHPGFERIKGRHGMAKVYLADVQVRGRKDIPVRYLNKELSYEMPDYFEYVPERIRNLINPSAKYETDGMVDDETLVLINKKSAPDVLFYGYITDDEAEDDDLYSLVLHAIDVEKGTELMKIRSKIRIKMKK